MVAVGHTFNTFMLSCSPDECLAEVNYSSLFSKRMLLQPRGAVIHLVPFVKPFLLSAKVGFNKQTVHNERSHKILASVPDSNAVVYWLMRIHTGCPKLYISGLCFR